MSENLRKYWNKQHYELYEQIEALERKKQELANESIESEYLGGRKVAVPKYNEWELKPLFVPIDNQIAELKTKFYAVPLNLGTRTMELQPLVYVTENEQFTIKWVHNKWKVVNELPIGVTNVQVITDSENKPIKISYLWLSTETYGIVYNAEITLKEHVEDTTPKVPLPQPKPMKIESIPTWVCSNPNCKKENYVELLNCRFCGTLKPIDKEPEQPKKESKLTQLKKRFTNGKE
jgi:hypothetical protein